MVQGKMCILRKDYFGVFFEIFFVFFKKLFILRINDRPEKSIWQAISGYP